MPVTAAVSGARFTPAGGGHVYGFCDVTGLRQVTEDGSLSFVLDTCVDIS